MLEADYGAVLRRCGSVGRRDPGEVALSKACSSGLL